MSDSLRDIYRALESRYVHEGRTIDPSFSNDLSDDSVAKFTAIVFLMASSSPTSSSTNGDNLERIKSNALKAKKESSDDETSTSGSDDEEYDMAVRNSKNFFRRKGKFVRQPREERKSFQKRDGKKGKSDRKCFRCDDPSHLIGDCLKISRN
nr:alpha/beta hydrolases superfamily protein [Tanacetum cinerariifolium]